jgi:hypothetical protein
MFCWLAPSLLILFVSICLWLEQEAVEEATANIADDKARLAAKNKALAEVQSVPVSRWKFV